MIWLLVRGKITGRTDFVVIDDESLRERPQAVAVGLGKAATIIQGTQLARVENR